MLTGKKLVDTLTAELGEIGMGNMASELDAMYRSPEFLELDLLSAIARLVETEYQAQTNKQTNVLPTDFVPHICWVVRRTLQAVWILPNGHIYRLELPKRFQLSLFWRAA